MKNRILLVVFLLLNFVSFSQTNYYSKSTGNLEVPANWGLNTDGTGAPPPNFSNASQVFNIRNRATATIGAAWTVSGAGSKIVVGNGVAACNFTIPATLAVSGTVDVSASATLTIINTTIPTLGSLNASSTVVFGRTNGGQNVPANTYGNLTLSNTSGTNTATGAIVVNAALVTTSGGTFALGANQLTGSLTSITHNGTLTTTSTANPAIPTGKTWTGTTGLVTFANTTGGQFIPAGTYQTLTCSNTSGTNTATGNLAVTGAFTTSAAGGTFNLVTNTFTAGSIVNTGTLATQNTSSTPLPTGITWGGVVNYNATTGAQTIMAGTYATLTLSNTSGTNTPSGNLIVNTLLSIPNAGSTLNMSTFTLTGTLTTITNNGIISTSNTSATPFATGRTWGGTGTVRYALTTGGQTIMAGTYTNNLQLSNTSGTNTASGVLTTNGTLTLPAGGTLNMVTFALAGTGVPAVSGTIGTQSTTNPALPASRTWGGTVIFDRTAGGQSIPLGTFNNLTLSNTSGSQTAQGALTVNGDLVTTSGGVLVMGANQLLGSLASITHNGTITTTSTTNPAIPAGKTWTGTTGLVTFANTTGGQFVPAGTYKTLTCSNTSGTNTAAGNLSVTGAFTTSSAGGTFNMVTNTLTAASIVNTGTIATQSTSVTPLPTGITWGGTVNYNATAGAQTIMAGTYATLTLSNTSGTNTASGNLVVNTLLNVVNAGSTLNMSTFTLLGTLTTITNNGTISTSNTSATPIAAARTWGGTVTYALTTGGQTIVNGTYASLTLLNTSGTNTANGAVNVNTGLTTTTGGTLNMSTFALGGTLTTITNNGTISTSNTTATPIAAAKTWGGTGTVAYAVLTGGQTLVSGTYARLSFLNTSGTNTAAASVTVNTSLTTTLGGTLNMSTFALGGTLTTVTNNGIITTSNTSTTPFTTGVTWGGTGTVRYALTTGGQTIMAGTYTCNLELSNTSGTNTASGVLTTNGTLTIPAGGTLDMVSFAIAGTGVPAVSGTIRTQSTTNPALPASKTWGGTINFDRTLGAQFIPSGTFNNLTLSNTSGNQNAQGALTVNGALVITSGGILTMGANQLLGSLTSLTNNGTITTTSNANPAIPSGKTWTGTTGLVTFARTTGGQFIPAGTYKTLTCSNTSGTNTATGNLTITGAFTTSAAGGTFDLVTNTFTAGSVVNTGTLATQNTSLTPLPTGLTWAGIVNYNATTGGQTIMAGTYATLRISNTSGTNTASGNLVVNTLLNLANAGSSLNMSTFTLSGTLTTITNNGTISTSNTTATPLTTGRTWGGTGTVRYAVTTGGQTIMTGTYTNNLELSNTSGTNTATGVLTTNGTLTIPAGGTLNMSTFEIAGTGVPAVSGTVRTQSTTNPALPASRTWGGTIIFERTNGGQNIPGGTFNNLTLTNTSGSQTARGALTVNGALVTINGGTLVMGTNQLLGSLSSVTHNGSISTASTANPAIPAGKDWSGTGGTSLVSFASTTGGQFIPGGTYKTLTATNTSNTNTIVSGDVNVTGTFTTVPAGGTLDAGTNAIAASVITNNGTILTQNTTSNPLPSGKTWAGTVNYNGTGAQTMVTGTFTNLALSSNRSAATITLENGIISLSGNFNVTATNIGGFNTGTNTFVYTGNTANTVGNITYNNLTLSNTSSTKTAGGAIVVNGALTTTSGGIFSMSTFQLSGSLTSIVHDGTLTTSSTSNPAIPSGKTWTGTTGLVQFTSTAGGQFIPAGTYKGLTCVNTSGTNTAVGNITVSNTFTTAGVGGTFNMGTNDLSANTITNTSATLRTQSTSATPLPNNKTIAGTVLYDATTGGQTIVTETSYLNLSMSNSTGTNAANGNIVVDGVLTTGTGTSVFDLSTFTLSGTLSSISGAGSIRTQNTSAAPIKVNQTWPQTVEYNNLTGGQTIVNGTYNAGLTNSNTSGVNTLEAASTITVNGNLTLSPSSVFSDNSRPITINGNITGSGTHNSVSTGAIIMTGAGGTISSATLGNITLNNVAGFTLTGSPQINGTLTFTNGSLDIANNNLIFGPSAPAVAGSPSSSKMIIISGTGEVRKRYSGLGSFTFPIGDATPNYSPFTVNLTGGTPGGSAYIGVIVDNINHPNDASNDDYLNRFWHVNVSDITTPEYSISGSYVDADIVGVETGILSASYSGALPWQTYGTVNAAANTINATALNGTNISYSGISGIVTTVTVSPASPSYCTGESTALTASSFAVPGLTYSWSPATGLSATTGASVTASATTGLSPTIIVYTLTTTDGNGVSSSTTRTLTVNPLPVVSAGSGVAICNGLSTLLTGTGAATYTWSPATNLSATTGATVTANPTSTITYTVAGTDVNGCVNTASKTVTVNALPTVSAGSDVAICDGSSTDLTGTGAVSYTWSPATNLSATTGATVTANPTSTITYTVTGTGVNGCTNTAPVTVTVNPLPVVDTIAGTLSVCIDATTALSNATGGGVWTSSTPSVATVGVTGIVTGVTAGTSTISYTVTDGFGCVNRVTKVVTVNPLPVINSLSGIFTTCQNVDLLMNSNIAFGTWSSSNISVGAVDTFAGVLIPASVGTTMVTYNVLSTGCSSTREVTVIQAPSVIVGVTAMCPGGTATLTTSPAGGTWTTSNPSVITVNSSTGEVTAVKVAYSGISVAGITYTIPNGCSRTVAPTVNPIPSPIYGGVTNICMGESTTFLSGSVGFTWSSSATGVATVSGGGVVTAQGPGVATISYTNGFGCANTRTVTVNAALSPNVGSSSICTGTSTTFTNSTPGGTWTSSNVSRATINLTTGLVTGANAGTTTLSYMAPSGCFATNVLTVNATPAVIGGTRSVCIGSTTLLGTTPSGGEWTSSNASIATVGSSSGVVSGVLNGTATMTYTAPGGCTRTAEVTVNALPASITGVGVACVGGGTALSNASGTWTSSNNGIATVNYLGVVTGVAAGTAIITFRNANTCITTREVTINPIPSPLVSPTGLCAGSTVTMTGTPSGGTWLSSNPSVFTINASTGDLTAVIVNTAGNSFAVVTYTLPTGCSRTALITINQQPSSIYGGTGKVCTGSTLAQFSGTSGLTWSSASPSVATISPIGVVTGVSAGNAVISYTSAAGCAAQRVITVNATPDVITGATSVVVGATTTLANATVGGTWSSSTTSRAIIGSASGVVTGMSIGATTITYTMPTGCFVTSAMNVVSAKGVAGQVSEEALSEVKIYPNPTTGTFSISTGIGGVMSVYTIDGKEVLHQQLSSGISSITLPNTIAAGLYTCKFTDVEGRVTIMRLLYDNK